MRHTHKYDTYRTAVRNFKFLIWLNLVLLKFLLLWCQLVLIKPG